MFRLWSEWPIGEENLLFASREAGMRWLHANKTVKELAQELAEEEPLEISTFVEVMFADGYFSWQPVEFIQ
jgi:hypothetical protein